MRIVLAACAALASGAAPEAGDLLHRVAEKYRAADAYTVEVRIRTEQGEPGVVSVGGERAKLAAAPGRRYRLERGFLRIVSDGRDVWSHRVDLRQYTVEPAVSAAAGNDAFRSAEQTFLRRFAALATASVETHFMHERMVKTRAGIRRVFVLQVRPRAPEPRIWTEELWIDVERDIVLRSVLRDVSPHVSLPPRTRTTIFERVELTSPDALEFRPNLPRTARRVEYFRERTFAHDTDSHPWYKQGP
ncbi:MAG TPA: hypothetical protein VFL57_03945 [Bryobacteraceae bacterium]|nr:hypothetical protein [Bryobacteraceae bacterium]